MSEAKYLNYTCYTLKLSSTKNLLLVNVIRVKQEEDNLLADN